MVQDQRVCKQVDLNIIAKFEDSHSSLKHVRYKITVRIAVFQRLAPQVFCILKYGTTNPDDI